MMVVHQMPDRVWATMRDCCQTLATIGMLVCFSTL